MLDDGLAKPMGRRAAGIGDSTGRGSGRRCLWPARLLQPRRRRVGRRAVGIGSSTGTGAGPGGARPASAAVAAAGAGHGRDRSYFTGKIVVIGSTRRCGTELSTLGDACILALSRLIAEIAFSGNLRYYAPAGLNKPQASHPGLLS